MPEPRTFFTADTHFNHRNVIEYCNRPFRSVNQMNETLIRVWNNTVGPNDHVWHLGDFAMGRLAQAEPILERLNGRLHLIIGNHDHEPIYKSKRWETVDTAHTLTVGGKVFWLLHYPKERWSGQGAGVIHLHGHSHGTSEFVHGRVDVGVDVWLGKPVTWEHMARTVGDRAEKPAPRQRPKQPDLFRR